MTEMTRSMSAELRGDLKVREAHGMEKYGTLLEPWNGRNPIEDAYEEAMDNIVYLKQAKVERQLSVERLRLLVDDITTMAGQYPYSVGPKLKAFAAHCEGWANDLEADIPRKRGKKTKKRERAPFEVTGGVRIVPFGEMFEAAGHKPAPVGEEQSLIGALADGLEQRRAFLKAQRARIDPDPILEAALKEADQPMSDEEMTAALVQVQDYRARAAAAISAAELWERAIKESNHLKEVDASMGEFEMSLSRKPYCESPRANMICSCKEKCSFPK